MRKTTQWIIGGIIALLLIIILSLLFCPYIQRIIFNSSTVQITEITTESGPGSETISSSASSAPIDTGSNSSSMVSDISSSTENAITQTSTSITTPVTNAIITTPIAKKMPFIGNLPMASLNKALFKDKPSLLFGYNNPDALIFAVHQKTLNILSQGSNLNPKVLQLALRAYACAHVQNIGNPRYITIIDYSLPSTTKRMWVIDLKTATVSFHTLVAHGKNSGGYTNTTSFSNLPGSDASSIGLFLTKNTYIGHNGYSLKLKGLEKGFNDNALQRDVVIHGAAYVNNDFVIRYGRLGRSWGCPALSKLVSTPVINEIKNGTLVFAYYPQASWLTSSTFLNCTVALPWTW